MNYQIEKSELGNLYFLMEDKKILKVFIKRELALDALNKIKVQNKVFVVKKKKVA